MSMKPLPSRRTLILGIACLPTMSGWEGQCSELETAVRQHAQIRRAAQQAVRHGLPEPENLAELTMAATMRVLAECRAQGFTPEQRKATFRWVTDLAGG